MIIAADITMPLTLAFKAADLLPAAGITLIIMSLLMGYRKRRRSQTPRRTPHEELDRARQLRGMRGDLEQLMVEIQQLAQRFASQLDARTMEMDMVIKRADERIAELKRLLGDAATDAGDRADARQADEAPDSDAPAVAGVLRAVDPPDLASSRPDPLSQSVYRLSDQGLDPQAIADRLEEHIGKVELILALRTAG